MQKIKNNLQVYTTQQGIEETNNNPHVYITQEGIEEIKKTSDIHYRRGYA